MNPARMCVAGGVSPARLRGKLSRANGRCLGVAKWCAAHSSKDARWWWLLRQVTAWHLDHHEVFRAGGSARATPHEQCCEAKRVHALPGARTLCCGPSSTFAGWRWGCTHRPGPVISRSAVKGGAACPHPKRPVIAGMRRAANVAFCIPRETRLSTRANACFSTLGFQQIVLACSSNAGGAYIFVCVGGGVVGHPTPNSSPGATQPLHQLSSTGISEWPRPRDFRCRLALVAGLERPALGSNEAPIAGGRTTHQLALHRAGSVSFRAQRRHGTNELKPCAGCWGCDAPFAQCAWWCGHSFAQRCIPATLCFAMSPACPVVAVIGRHATHLWPQPSSERSSVWCCRRPCFVSKVKYPSAWQTVMAERNKVCTHDAPEGCQCFEELHRPCHPRGTSQCRLEEFGCLRLASFDTRSHTYAARNEWRRQQQ
ncbi:hypothetical protein TvY486_0007390 [Trypanosoma vivax Y486]|uniref:Uncharacterized protein n=1 Tax=Trypanosoma vivax (strain Y486) TaxID=1055687 RepID=F9WKS3_TRYVY|nr:hypothetical protein TvY486_0007390 [Trypanosoma vivax Y486]|eukprot:CCD18098.1 hypothetical protein TvY486_0007390 [Trypanosoma vivax Y486]